MTLRHGRRHPAGDFDSPPPSLDAQRAAARLQQPALPPAPTHRDALYPGVQHHLETFLARAEETELLEPCTWYGDTAIYTA